MEDNNIYEEVIIDGKKEKIVIKINDGSIENNNDFDFLEDTIEIELNGDNNGEK